MVVVFWFVTTIDRINLRQNVVPPSHHEDGLSCLFRNTGDHYDTRQQLGREESYSSKNYKYRHVQIDRKDTEPPELEQTKYKCVQIQSLNPKGKRRCLTIVSKRFAKISYFIQR